MYNLNNDNLPRDVFDVDKLLSGFPVILILTLTNIPHFGDIFLLKL